MSSNKPELTIVKVKAPTLMDMRSRPCSVEELQMVLVQLIDLHNAREEYERNRRAPKEEWQATI